MTLSFRNVFSPTQTKVKESQATLIQNLPCSFADDNLFYPCQCFTTQSQNGFSMLHTVASTSTTNSTFAPHPFSNCIDSFWITCDNSISRNATTSTVSMYSTMSTLPTGQTTLNPLKPMTAHSSMCHSQTNPTSFFSSVDDGYRGKIDNLPNLESASVTTPSLSPFMPSDFNWIGPTDYPAHLDYNAHSSLMHIRGTPFTHGVLLPNSQESVTKPFVQPTREAEMLDRHSATGQAMKTVFLEESFPNKTPIDSSDCIPPLEFVDVNNLNNSSFSYFPVKPRMPNAKFQPFISFPFDFRMNPPANESPVICEDSSYRRPSCTQFIKSQDINGMDPLFSTTNLAKPTVPFALLRKPPLATKRKSVKPHLRSGCHEKNLVPSNLKALKKTNKDPFCVQNLTEKFIHAAKNKQLSHFNAQETPAKLQRDVVPIAEQIALRSRKTTARHQAKKRVIQTIVMDQSPRKSRKLALQSMPVSENVELLLHDSPVQLLKPQNNNTDSHINDSDLTHLVPIAPSETLQFATTEFPLDRRFKAPVPTSKVDIKVNNGGNLFVTIRPIAPSHSITAKKSQSSKKVNSREKPISPNLSERPGKTNYHTSLSSTKKENRFCVQSLVAKFIQAAKQKQTSYP